MSPAFKIVETNHFPGKVTSLAHIDNANKIVKEKPTSRQLEMLRRTVFGQFVDMDVEAPKQRREKVSLHKQIISGGPT